MSPQQYVQETDGKAVTYDGLAEDYGQCEQLVCDYWHKVYGFACPMIPLAKDLITNEAVLASFETIPVGQEQAWDVAVFDASSSINSPEAGHTDIVLAPQTNGFIGWDSNWGGVTDKYPGQTFGYPAAHQVTHSYADVIGFLRWKEPDMNATKEQLEVIYSLAFPNQNVNEDWCNGWAGKDMNDAVNALRDDPSRQAYISRIVNDAAAFEALPPTQPAEPTAAAPTLSAPVAPVSAPEPAKTNTAQLAVPETPTRWERLLKFLFGN